MTATKSVEELVSPEELAARWSVDVSTVFRWMKRYHDSEGKDGLGPVVKLGRRITRVPASAANVFWQRRQVMEFKVK